MAAALIDYGRSCSVQLMPENVENFKKFLGEGICGKMEGKYVYIGNIRIALKAGYETVKKERVQGLCTSEVNEAAALQAQEQLGNILDHVHANFLPEDKARILTDFKKEGSALVTETGNVILMSNELRKVPKPPVSQNELIGKSWSTSFSLFRQKLRSLDCLLVESIFTNFRVTQSTIINIAATPSPASRLEIGVLERTIIRLVCILDNVLLDRAASMSRRIVAVIPTNQSTVIMESVPRIPTMGIARS
ncbi:hypothetical protein ACFE04_010140 [Oxalis oulophora]